MSYRIRVLLLCLAASTVFSRGDLIGQRQEILSLTPQWEERWERYPRVSGRLIPGIMVGDPTGSVGEREIFVRVSQRQASALCVTVSSRDGHYHARAVLEVEAGTNGVVRLRGLRERRIRGYRAGDVAIRAELGTCEGTDRVLLPATWDRNSAWGDVLVYVNVRQYTRAAWRNAAGEQVEADCTEIGGTASVAYNRVCRLPAAMVPRRARVTVERRQDGSISSEAFWLEHAR